MDGEDWSTAFSSTTTWSADQKVDSIAAVEDSALVFDGDVDLPSEWDPAQIELAREAVLVRRLEQTRAEALDGPRSSPDDLRQ